ncbi:hypothetical protein AB4401_08525 [Vibrio cyclitrophicus]|uniref:hypothetical protein n=1 Tax=Vibrio TaxID=662 RepID=UPI0006E55435|nr:hypothetical protein [Vibrio splendidus]KPL98178.1 hypothetical protein AN167_19330 [Vibrio splendidus]PMG19351.1 hypothetical protein BCU95_21995 [Vibrio splendidus]PMO02992.1 hypothetical protein BCT19_03865 [Vibrio splendidus]
MDPLLLPLLVTTLSTTGFATTLIRHLLFKRQLHQLKQEMMRHQQQHGNDEALWTLFHTRTHKLLSFWQ